MAAIASPQMVVMAVPQNSGNGGKHGNVAGSVAAKQLPSVVACRVILRAKLTNAGNVYVGNSNAVIVPAASADSVIQGFPLDAGDTIGIILPTGNLNALWIICDNAADDLQYFVEV